MIFDLDTEKALSPFTRAIVLKDGLPLGCVQSIDTKGKTCRRMNFRAVGDPKDYTTGELYDDTYDVLVLVTHGEIPPQLQHLVPAEAVLMTQEAWRKRSEGD